MKWRGIRDVRKSDTITRIHCKLLHFTGGSEERLKLLQQTVRVGGPIQLSKLCLIEVDLVQPSSTFFKQIIKVLSGANK